MKRLTLVFCLLFTVHFLQGQNLLFVGNSLTYSHDLPHMVREIAAGLGQKLETTCLCFPNYGLEDHWNDSKLQKMIKSGNYDFVVFQQGPSSQVYGRQSLIEYGGKISALAKKHEVQPAYFMVWPSLAYYQTFEGVIKNHRDAAEAHGAMLIPLGAYWRKLRETNFAPTLYGPDGFHPSKAGSFLAALRIFKTLFPKATLRPLPTPHAAHS